MSKKILLEDIRRDPARIYRTPADVLRDRRFADLERLEILRAWRDRQDDAAGGIGAMIAELEQRLALAGGHAAH